MESDNIIYSLSIQDLQTVAQEEFGRILSKSEIDIIAEKIGNHIDWYSIILETIHQHIEINQQTI